MKTANANCCCCSNIPQLYRLILECYCTALLLPLFPWARPSGIIIERVRAGTSLFYCCHIRISKRLYMQVST